MATEAVGASQHQHQAPRLSLVDTHRYALPRTVLCYAQSQDAVHEVEDLRARLRSTSHDLAACELQLREATSEREGLQRQLALATATQQEDRQEAAATRQQVGAKAAFLRGCARDTAARAVPVGDGWRGAPQGRACTRWMHHRHCVAPVREHVGTGHGPGFDTVAWRHLRCTLRPPCCTVLAASQLRTRDQLLHRVWADVKAARAAAVGTPGSTSSSPSAKVGKCRAPCSFLYHVYLY